MTQLVPYAPPDFTQRPATMQRTGQISGVAITLHPDAWEEFVARVERWFAGRQEVEIVDAGTSDKQGLGFLLMEWMGYEIDPLFIAILDDEEIVGDYTLYGRAMEV